MSTEARRIGTDFYIFILVADIYVPGTHIAHRIYLYQVKKREREGGIEEEREGGVEEEREGAVEEQGEGGIEEEENDCARREKGEE